MGWFDRLFPKSPLPVGPSVGIGMLVAVVTTAEQQLPWDDDPVGVVIAPGDKELAPYPGLQRPRYWTVAFEEGPVQQGTFPEWRLRVLEAHPGP